MLRDCVRPMLIGAFCVVLIHAQPWMAWSLDKELRRPLSLPGQPGRGAPDKLELTAIGVPASQGPKFPDTGVFNLEERERLQSRIDRLIPQLAENSEKARDEVMRELQTIAAPARSALERATEHENPEIAQRCQTILATFPPLTHEIVDADLNPIPYARVISTMTARSVPEAAPAGQQPESRVVADWSDELGRVAIPLANGNTVECTAQIYHPDYGWGFCDVELRVMQRQLCLPLARRGTQLRSRSVQGVVVSPDGMPVAGAIVHCNHVRTAGEGLINGSYPRGAALTDNAGRFSYYLPNENADRSRGDVIPPGSRYDMFITKPDDDSYFPVAIELGNSNPVRVEMARPTAQHRFRFQSVGGGWLEKPEQLRNLRVQRTSPERKSVTVDAASLIRGRRILEGTYTAVYFDSGKTVPFEPIHVRSDSPEELTFEVPIPVVYRGRVMHGVTQTGVPGAFVIGWRSTARNNLALLTDDEWTSLETTPSNPAQQHPSWKLLEKHFGVQGFVRTDDEGRFEIARGPDQEFYGLMAFDRNSIPFAVRLGSVKPRKDQVVETGELPLFPAARVLVRPNFDSGRVSIAPEWLPTAGGQPEWFPQFKAVKTGSDRDFHYIHWLVLNETQPVYVPAGIQLRLRFETPYNDEWAPAMIDGPLTLDPGATVDLGDLQFAASLSAQVQVVDRNGKPVEGFAVRRKYNSTNAWCVAHNTDERGKAFFYVHPHSQGQFRVTDLQGSPDVTLAKNLSVDFQIGETTPKQVFQIQVTDEQIAALRKGK